MANSFFKFKQFTVHQDKCAMKVCTDACLFGAIAAQIKAANALDIGAGTGLLSLMFAQKNNLAKIDAVEIDDNAFAQAKENFSVVDFAKNIQVHHRSIQDFSVNKNEQYDLIFSNPPFFENDLKSPNDARNSALHSSKLTLKELAETVQKLLSENGVFGLLLPYARTEYFIRLAQKENLFLQKKYLIRQSSERHFFRSILFFGKKPTNCVMEEITIKETDDKYSLRFIELLKDYYLYL